MKKSMTCSLALTENNVIEKEDKNQLSIDNRTTKKK